jgi:hypothetical protein
VNLNDLYPRGTRLIDVPPNFEGMPVREWTRAKVFSMIRAHCDAAPKIAPEDAPLSRQREWNPRDDYGWRSM